MPTTAGRSEVRGRDAERSVLRASLDAALAGRGRLVLVTGEPGIGKTTLAEDVAATAQAEGATVVWGRCWDAGGAPALWPWSQIVRRLAEDHLDDDALAAAAGPHARLLCSIAPALAARLPGDEPPVPAEPGQAAFALYEAIATLLTGAAARSPLVVMLDDLHAADPASARALGVVEAAVRDAPALLVATLQVEPLRARPDLEELVGALDRRAERLDLEGLPREVTAGLLAERAGGTVPAAVVRAIQARTNGNPLFVGELGRTLGTRLLEPTSVADAPLPDGLREAVRPRLDALGAQARELLEVAAVIGHEFRVVVLERAAGLRRAEVLDLLDEAEQTGVVATSRGRPGVASFAHGLLREALYDGLATRRRAELHGAVAEALEALAPAEVPDAQLAELAHHFTLGATVGDPERALAYAERAARRAARVAAHDQAADHWQQALLCLDLLGPDPLREASLLLELGREQQAAGHDDARATLLRAATAAEVGGDASLLAEAAAAFGPYGLSPGSVDQVWIDLLDRALATVGEEHPDQRVRLLARRSRATYFDRGADTRRAAEAEEAIAAARELGDGRVLAEVLADVHLGLWAPERLDACLALIDELQDLLDEAGAPQAGLPSLLRAADLRLTAGDVAGSWEIDERAERLAERHRDARGRAIVRMHHARRALLEGRFAAMDALHADALGIAVWLRDSPVPMIVGGQSFARRRLEGGVAELEPAVRGAADALPAMPVWRSALAALLLDLGREDEAVEQAQRLLAPGLGAIPRNDTWLMAVGILGEVVARTGLDGAAELRAALEPHAGRLMNSTGGTYAGMVSRSLALLDQAVGEPEAALARLAEVQQAAAAAGAAPDRLLARADEIALRHAAGEDVGELRAAALEAAARLGMAPVAERLQRVDAPARKAGPKAEQVSAEGRLVREGDVWTLGVGDREVRLKDARGVRHLAVLLARPGVEVSALDLETAPGGAPARAAATEPDAGTGEGDLGEVLDATARAAYRARAEELRDELEMAERYNDPERASAARAELQILADELAGASGLGGRARRTGSPAERARVNVTRAIKAVLRRVSQHDEVLGRELTATVRTGTFCAYEPDPRRPVAWEVRGGR